MSGLRVVQSMGLHLEDQMALLADRLREAALRIHSGLPAIDDVEDLLTEGAETLDKGAKAIRHRGFVPL